MSNEELRQGCNVSDQVTGEATWQLDLTGNKKILDGLLELFSEFFPLPDPAIFAILHMNFIPRIKAPADLVDHACDLFRKVRCGRVTGTVLLARELPPAGGDTMFASMTNAYETLSDGMKKTLEGLRGIHAKSVVFDQRDVPKDRQVEATKMARLAPAMVTKSAVHPVAPRHPETGRRLLYVSPTYTGQFEGWTEEESRPLLHYLFDHASRPENTCRFRWEVGSVAFWDNRVVWHRALNDYHGSRRLMHRVAIAGKGFGPF